MITPEVQHSAESAKIYAQRHRWPRKTVTRLTTKGPTPKFLRKVWKEERTPKGFSWPEETDLGTPAHYHHHKTGREPQGTQRQKTDHFPSEQILVVCSPQLRRPKC